MFIPKLKKLRLGFLQKYTLAEILIATYVFFAVYFAPKINIIAAGPVALSVFVALYFGAKHLHRATISLTLLYIEEKEQLDAQAREHLEEYINELVQKRSMELRLSLNG